MTEQSLQANLQAWFGYTDFRTGQKEPIESVLKGHDTVAILPTGTGKSLIYQYCAYSLEGITLIVSPLLSLMDNQVLQLKRAGEKRAAALNSMSSSQERSYIENNLSRYKFLFLSPEMLQAGWLLKKLMKVKIGLFVVDEAHCISQWGMDFRPDYLSLGRTRHTLGDPLTLALTATAPERVVQDIITALELGKQDTEIHQYDPNRPNLFYDVMETSPERKDELLLTLINKYPLPGIIYFTNKQQAEKVCQLIQMKTEWKADTYHADRTLEDRSTIQRQFLEGNLQIICATSAFGMGINKADIRLIIHYHLPGSLEEYLQEAGRAGRDGNQSIVILLYTVQDVFFKVRKTQETALSSSQIVSLLRREPDLEMRLSDSDRAFLQIINQKGLNDTEARELIENRIREKLNQLQSMKDFAETSECKRSFLSSHFGHHLLERPSWCCSSCNKNSEVLIKSFSSPDPGSSVDESLQIGWEEKIKNLFSL